MARPFHMCPHIQNSVETKTDIRLSCLELEPAPGKVFRRKYALPETAGCAECRAREGYVDNYFAIPIREGESVLDALLEAVGRFGGVLNQLAAVVDAT